MSNTQTLDTIAHDAGRRQNAGDTLTARFAAWRTFRRTRSELMSLSDRELRDLGIGRSSITAVARDAAYGRD